MNPSWLPELLGIDAVLQLDDYVKEFDVVKNGEIPVQRDDHGLCQPGAPVHHALLQRGAIPLLPQGPV